jgi:hypothetical protein
VSTCVEAQEDIITTYNGTINDQAYEQQWTLHAQAGTEISVQMNATSGNLDPYLVLLAPDGIQLVEDDDGGVESNSAFTHILPASGTYTIVAGRFGSALGSSAGAYTLTISQPGDSPVSEDRVSSEQTYSGHLSDQTFEEIYSFDGRAGDVINVRMDAVSGDLDPLVQLLDSHGEPLIQNDDAAQGETNNSALTYTLSAPGSYTLVLLREHVLTPGDFQHTGEGRILMTDSARRFFIARYQEHMAMSVRYPAWDQELTYRQCIKRQAEHMARCIQGRDEAYLPLLLA